MKNLYFLAAVAAFVLGSCTVKEALDPPADPDDEAKAIGFDTFLDRVPQNGIKPLANIMDINGLKGRNPGFRVQAYEHAKDDWNDDARTATNYMSGQTVTWSTAGSSWTYSPIKYWPVSGSDWAKVSFFAYIPTTGSMGVTFVPAKAAGENPKLYCIMPSDYPSQVDLIVDAEYNLTGDADKVTFKFDHVLSRIGFKAKTSYAPATVTISAMSFYYGDLKRTGTYTFNSGTSNGDDKNNKAGKWDVTGGIPPTLGYLLISSATLSGTESLDISGTLNTSGIARYLMLIPQENVYGQAYVQVAYKIEYPPGSGHPNVTVPGEKVYLPSIPWEPGIAYTYTLNIAGPREMTFHVEKDNWNGWGSEVPGDIFYP